MSLRVNVNKAHTKFDDLSQNGRVSAEYIWIDGTGINLRSKTKVLDKLPTSVAELPWWNYDGSSTYQATTENSEVHMKPVAMYRDPFRGGDNILVLTESFVWKDGTFTEMIPANTNFRHFAEKIFEATKEHEPWFGIEQEYNLLEEYNEFVTWPYGWPKGGCPPPQGPYYCSVGKETQFGREVLDAHIKACLFAGVKVSGANSEVMPGQMEFQIGPCEGIKQGDDLWVGRYILMRVAEEFGIAATFKPKLFPDWNGAGCHTNFSTKKMREDNGLDEIMMACQKLEPLHKKHISLYGEGNKERLTGVHETADINTYSYGIGNRGASIRIPTSAKADKKGYMEDRRPASNINPYVVTALLMDSIYLDGKASDDMIKHYQEWNEWKKTQGKFNFI